MRCPICGWLAEGLDAIKAMCIAQHMHASHPEFANGRGPMWKCACCGEEMNWDSPPDATRKLLDHIRTCPTFQDNLALYLISGGLTSALQSRTVEP